MTENITINDISHFLIHNSYQLTALEFDFELIERGLECKFLRNFFTNPENFEHVSSHVEIPINRIKTSPSISTIDSIDFAKYSDDGLQQSDERIKVLEFELRKKNEEVRKLREELTLMSTSKTNKFFVVDWISDSMTHNENSEIETAQPLMAHENRALNFLVNEYLLQHGFKLTAVSFSEEIADQDLDTWDDVGLNIPKLPNLECFLRAKRPFIENNPKELSKIHLICEVGLQTDPISENLVEQYIASNNSLQNTIDLQKEQIEFMSAKYEKSDSHYKEQTQLIAQLKKELNDSRSKLICAQRDLMYESAKKKVVVTGNQSTSGDTDFKSETMSIASDAFNEISNPDMISKEGNRPGNENRLENEKNSEKLESDDVGISTNVYDEMATHRTPTIAFSKSLRLINEDAEVDNNLVSLVDSLDQCISLITDILPNLFEAVNDKNNTDLTMLLVQCACLHPDSKTREKLLKFLINLHPEPSVTERGSIMKQIQILSGYLGAFRVEAELITQIWEMLYEKPRPNANKRILLANICGVVCPLAPSNLRGSLILSIHQQMLEEENDTAVIPQILSSISSTIPYLEDVDKIPHVIQILSKYLWRPEAIMDGRKSVLDNEIIPEEVVKCKLLPAVAQWCLDAGILHTTLIHDILISMKNLNMTPNKIEYHAICLHLNVIQLLAPFIEVWIKSSTPQILDDVAYEISEYPSLMLDNAKSMELYRIELIVNRDKYNQINHSFVRYTGVNLPRSMITCSQDNPTESNETIQCWTPWPELKWLQVELINTMVCFLSNIQSKVDKLDLNDFHVINDLAKHQFTSAPLKSKDLCIKIGAILYELGCRFTAPVISNVFIPCFTRYLFESTEKGVDCNVKSDAIGTGIVSGYCALLAALVRLDNTNMAADNLKKFLTNISFLVAAESLPYDGVKLAVDVLSSALGNINPLSKIILASLQPCIACSNVPVRLFVCLIIQELVIQLSNVSNVEDQIFVAILESLRSLIDCSYEPVKVMAIGPLVSLLQTRSISASTRIQVFNCLSELMTESTHVRPELCDRSAGSNTACTEMLVTALIQMINVVGPTSPESFKDDAILPWLLGITEINNGTADTARRSGIAMILYSTFSTLNYYLESSNGLETYFLPALDRLKLDMLELYPENVKEVESMSQDIRKRIETKQKLTGLDTGHNMKSKIAGLNFMTRTANATSSATSSIFGKFKDLKSEDLSDQVSVTKSNITNFFSKRR